MIDDEKAFQFHPYKRRIEGMEPTFFQRIAAEGAGEEEEQESDVLSLNVLMAIIVI